MGGLFALWGWLCTKGKTNSGIPLMYMCAPR